MTTNAPPPPQGKDVEIQLFVDFNQTRRSQTGFKINLNMSPVMVWSSVKKKATIKTIMFENGVLVTNNRMESWRGLCYKLMMGVYVPFSGPTFISYCDNKSDIQPESMSKKRSDSEYATVP